MSMNAPSLHRPSSTAAVTHRLVLVLGIAAAAPAAAGVLVVGPPGTPGVDHSSLPDAVAAAADGDVLLLHPGGQPYTIIDGKGLTVVAATDTRPILQGLRVRNVPAGSSVRLASLEVRNGSSPFDVPLRVENCAGSVVVQDSLVRYASVVGGGQEAANVSACAAVAFTRCELRGIQGVNGDEHEPWYFSGDGGEALISTMSHVWLHDCHLAAGDGGQGDGVPGGDGGDALVQDGGIVDAFGSRVLGGDGANGFVGDLISGFTPAPGHGGAAARITNGGLLRHQDSVFRAGLKAFASIALAPIQLDASSTALQLGGIPALFEGAAKLTENSVTTLSIRGTPGAPVVGLLGAQHAATTVPDVFGALFTAPPFVALPLGATDAAGRLNLDVAVPRVAPGIEGVPLTLQALVAPASAAPTALTNPHAVAWLAAGF